MKINPQLEALLRRQDPASGSTSVPLSPEKSFGATLAQQLQSDASLADTAGAAVPPVQTEQVSLVSQMLVESIQPASAGDADTAVMQAAFEQASGTLDMFDAYRSALDETSQGSLRQAYDLLQGIDEQVASLRNSPAREQSPGFDSLLNELEVLATTEKFKFNRGDYTG